MQSLKTNGEEHYHRPYDLLIAECQMRTVDLQCKDVNLSVQSQEPFNLKTELIPGLRRFSRFTDSGGRNADCGITM